MSDQMREEFEEWCKRTQGGNDRRNDDGEYVSEEWEYSWWAWQASRASLCVELPPEEEHKGVHYDIGYMPTDSVIKAITKTGVRVK